MSATTKKQEKPRVKTPEAILSYPNIFEPGKPDDSGKRKYGATFIFVKGTDLKELKQAAMQVGIAKYGPEFPDKVRAGKLHWPFRSDADDVREKGYPEGSTFINARSERQPGVVSRFKDPKTGLAQVVTDPKAVYPGVIVRATVNPYTFDRNGKKGVTFGLGNIQIIRDGDRLDSFVAAENEFDAEDMEPADLGDLDQANANDDAEGIDELLK